MENADLAAWIAAEWDEAIVPALVDYIRIPNQSPHFDTNWEAHGHMEQAVELVAGWCRERLPEGATLEILRLPGRTPVLLVEVPGTGPGEVLLYGHLDKQPPMEGWHEDLGPWKPVLKDDRLYGRGGADDGYAAFASLTALRALRRQGVPHGRCTILIEACEESGSYDLPFYLATLTDRIGSPDIVVCLDSGCGNYDQLWCTTSLRGLVVGTLTVEALTEGIHSGDGGGVVPETFSVARRLLDRLEDAETGSLRLSELVVDIPDQRRSQAAAAAQVLAGEVGGKYPLLQGVRPLNADPVELVLNRTWRAALAVTGQEGLLPLGTAGNVLRPRTALKLSLRLPPTCDPAGALQAVKTTLERDPPFGTRVSFDAEEPCAGWNAPEVAPWLDRALNDASQAFFGRPACAMGEGGSIPFMAMLGQAYPRAQFMITGVLGPKSNAHGPNEFLHIPTGKRLTACVAQVLGAHSAREQA